MTEDLAPHVQDIARALSNRLDPEAIEDELRKYLDYGVPLAQAKRDIVRNHGGSLKAGARKLSDLMGGENGVDLLVRVQTVNQKQIQTKNGPKDVWYGFLADDTRSVSYTAWRNPGFEKGKVYDVKNASVRVFRDTPEINIGDYAAIAPSSTNLQSVEGFPRSGGPAPRPTSGDPVPVKDLRDGMNGVTVVARVVESETKDIQVQGQMKTIVKGVLADATGRIGFTAWQPTPGLAAGAAVRISGAYVKTWRGPELNLGDSATVAVATDPVPAADALPAARRANLLELESAGGGLGVEVEGVILEVKPGSGLVFRCIQCNRVQQKRECRLHGRVEGTPDLRVKAVLDDGYGTLILLVGKEGTERLLGKTFEECQKLAKEAMSTDVVEDEVRQKLLGRRLLVRGNATSDEFGLQLIAHDASISPKRDAKAEAEAILEELADLGYAGVPGVA